MTPDPEAFLARYRERTGTDELHVNQATVGYFAVVSAAKVFGQILHAARAMYEGTAASIITAYNLNAAAVGHLQLPDRVRRARPSRSPRCATQPRPGLQEMTSMISRPTTDQLILDCRRELLDVVLPDVQSEHVRVSVQMLENILRNVATRAAHEIAWMRDGDRARSRRTRATCSRCLPIGAATVGALAALRRAPRGRALDLADVVETYSRAGEAFSCALEARDGEGHTRARARGRPSCSPPGTPGSSRSTASGRWSVVHDRPPDLLM